MARIFIMGAGGFGTALAVMAERYGNSVTLWSPFDAEVEELVTYREHRKLLEGIKISEEIAITSSPAALCEQDLVIIAVPSFAVRETARLIASRAPENMTLVCVSKGLELKTYKRLSEVMCEELPRNKIVMLSGPSHAEEVARGVPTTVVAASQHRDAAEYVQDALINDKFRIYANDDVIGVELGGALKNVIALAAGILDGLSSGDNTRAALMTRGIAEIARLGVAMGARSETFAGLSGFGDLIVTCSSMYSRNRRCGILIGQGVPPAKAVKQIGMTVEGYPATKTAYELALRENITMPITAEAYSVLFEGKSPEQAMRDLMDRPKRHESEAIWLMQKYTQIS